MLFQPYLYHNREGTPKVKTSSGSTRAGRDRSPLRPRPRSACLLLLVLLTGTREDPKPPAVWQVVTEVMTDAGQQEALSEVVLHLQKMTQTRQVAGTSPRIRAALAAPWTLPDLAGELRQDLLLSLDAGRVSPAFWLALPGWLPPEGEDPGFEPARVRLEEIWSEVADPETREEELLERLSELMAEAHMVLDEGLARLGDAERALLQEGHEAFSEAWYRSHFPGESLRAEQQAAFDAYLRLLLRVDLGRPRRVAEILIRLTDPDFLETLGRRLARTGRRKVDLEGLGGDVVTMVGADASSRVILGGSRKTHYGVPAALIIDLGGDDVYARCAVTQDASLLASVVIDLKGDDEYVSAEGPVYTIGGVSLLLDRRGDDRYQSGRHGQSSSVAGVAWLIDEEGNDRYEAEDYGQGYSLCGVALLQDLGGNDAYVAHAYAQGAGNAMAFAALVDTSGDDQYRADGHWPDVYGDSGPEVYHGAAQGYCTGFRGSGGSPELAGGYAALLDLDGDDRYQAGNFSQGGGYYFSFGLMYDGGGDDQNVGARYSQGFGVHQALGVRWDAAGNDRYRTRVAANCGSAWDEGVGFLLEDGGDDEYEAGSLALGGAAQTAVAVLLDRGGNDVYRSASSGGVQGGGGSSEYHGKPSIGVLIDLGGGRDQYSAPGREDGAVLCNEGFGVFVDAREDELDRWRESWQKRRRR